MYDTVQLKQGKLERDLERNSSVFDEDEKPSF